VNARKLAVVTAALFGVAVNGAGPGAAWAGLVPTGHLTGAAAAASGVGRPVIIAAPKSIRYGQGFVIRTPQGASIESVVMILESAFVHPPSGNLPTHELTILQRGPGSLTVAAPGDAKHARPGRYLLFVTVRALGQSVSSVGRLILLLPPPPAGSGPPPEANPGVGASAGGQQSGATGDSAASGTGQNGHSGSGSVSGSGSGSGSRPGHLQPAALHASPAGSRSPLGRFPWMPIALVVAFVATAVGLKRIA
jgi:hypothetical protein